MAVHSAQTQSEPGLGQHFELRNLYRFVSIATPAETGRDLLFLAREAKLKGILLIAPEGFNFALWGRPLCWTVFLLHPAMTLADDGLHLELIHANRKAFSQDAPLFIRDRITLPGILLLKSRPFLRRLYHDENLSTNAIARRIGASQSTVSDAIHRHGLIKDAKQPKKGRRLSPTATTSRKERWLQTRRNNKGSGRCASFGPPDSRTATSQPT